MPVSNFVEYLTSYYLKHVITTAICACHHQYRCIRVDIIRRRRTEKHDRSTTVHNIHAFSLLMRHQATDCCQLTNKPVCSVVGLCWDSAEQVSTSWTRLVQ